MTLTPRAKIEQELRAQVFLSFSDDFMGTGVRQEALSGYSPD